MRGNNGYKIPVFALKGKAALVLFTVDGHVSSTKVF